MSLAQLTGLILLLFLGTEALNDYKKKRINMPALVITFILVILMIFISKDYSLMQRVLGVCAGGVLIIFSLATRGKFGMGDALVLTLMFLTIGITKGILLYFLSLIYTMCYSAVLLVTKRGNKNTELAFMPFLLFAYVTSLLL